MDKEESEISKLRCENKFKQIIEKINKNESLLDSDKIKDDYSISLFYEGFIEESYSLMNSLLTSGSNLNFQRIRKNSSFCISKLIDKYSLYPSEIISKIKPKNNNNLIFTITTCKRLDLFEKSMNSFLNCCSDINLIDEWLCIDDGSSEKDIMIMKEKYPFLNICQKHPNMKGHSKSIQLIQSYIIVKGYKYQFHTEDDLQFHYVDNYLSKCMKVLNENNKYLQCLINIGYVENGQTDWKIYSGPLEKTKDGLNYHIHIYFWRDSDEYKEHFKEIIRDGMSTNAHWPSYSLRTSLVNCEIYSKVGFVRDVKNFEKDYGHLLISRGYVSTYLPYVVVKHIGPNVKDYNGINAYKLNGTNR